jgi:hypothetical protein
MGAAVSLTMYQRRRLHEGRKWPGQPRKGFGDHLARISPETIAMALGVAAVVFVVAGVLAIIRSGVWM